MASPLTSAMTGFSSAPDMNGSSLSGRAVLERFLDIPSGAKRSARSGENRDLQFVAFTGSVRLKRTGRRIR